MEDFDDDMLVDSMREILKNEIFNAKNYSYPSLRPPIWNKLLSCSKASTNMPLT